MSASRRNLLTVLLLLLLSISAFTAGFLTREVVATGGGARLPAAGEDNLGVFWEAWDRVEANFIGELPQPTQRTYGAIRGALQLLNDPYTVLVEPAVRDQERETLRGTFGGIGAILRRPEEGGDILLEPIPGNPAESAGIQFGDVLLAVDDVTITPEMTVQEVGDLIRGEKGTVVRLTVRRPDADGSVEIEIERDDILIPSVSYRLLEGDPRIGYIQLTRFSGESSQEIAAAVRALQAQDAASLILDLRGNGGGLLDAAVAVADHFLEGGVIVIQESRRDGESRREASRQTIAPETPLIVLVDGGTASAAEILAGALQDRARALLIGQRTFGKGSVQLVFDLSDGSSVHVTSARWLTPNRQQIDLQGLQPDIDVTVTQEDIDNGRDAILNRAVTYLRLGE